MSAIELAIDSFRRIGGIGHLGEEPSWTELYSRIQLSFQSREQALKNELTHLRRLNLLGLSAAIMGFFVILVALLLLLDGSLALGSFTGIIGLLAEFVSLLVVRQAREVRRSISTLLPDYKGLFGFMVLAELAQQDTDLAKATLRDVFAGSQ